MSDKTSKKQRGANFSVGDKALLLNIVEGYNKIIENKKTDAVWSREKENAWREVAADFNRSSENGRTPQQLKTAYVNYKRRAKRAAADDKVNNETI